MNFGLSSIPQKNVNHEQSVPGYLLQTVRFNIDVLEASIMFGSIDHIEGSDVAKVLRCADLSDLGATRTDASRICFGESGGGTVW